MVKILQEKRGLEALVRGLDIIARDLNGYLRIPFYLSFTGAVLTIVFVVFLVLLPSSISILAYTVMMLGFIAYTIQFTVAVMIMYNVKRHLEYSSYYYSQANDILDALDLPYSEDLVEKLMLLRIPKIEYVTVALLVGYLGLLYQSLLYVSIPLLILFSSIVGYYLYVVFDRFNKHAVIEDQIDKIMISSLNVKVNYSRNTNTVNPLLLIILTILTCTVNLVYYTLVFNELFDTHLSEHRYLHHRIMKPTLYKMIMARKEGSTV
jgi:hypothetical protein